MTRKARGKEEDCVFLQMSRRTVIHVPVDSIKFVVHSGGQHDAVRIT